MNLSSDVAGFSPLKVLKERFNGKAPLNSMFKNRLPKSSGFNSLFDLILSLGYAAL